MSREHPMKRPRGLILTRLPSMKNRGTPALFRRVESLAYRCLQLPIPRQGAAPEPNLHEAGAPVRDEILDRANRYPVGYVLASAAVGIFCRPTRPHPVNLRPSVSAMGADCLADHPAEASTPERPNRNSRSPPAGHRSEELF